MSDGEARMELVHAYGVDAAPSARGHVVVIDVLRAFTTAAYAFGAGAGAIALVGTAEEAFRLRERWPEAVLAGESEGRPIPGFDFGNNPPALRDAALSGRRVILRSSSGTQGVVRATAADRVLLGSLVVASATARLLEREAPRTVTFLAMGSPYGPDGPEDRACGRLMADLLAGRQPDVASVLRDVDRSPAAEQARNPGEWWITPEDLACAVDVDRFPFAMVVERRDGILVAFAVPA